jgi:hypothetical protein
LIVSGFDGQTIIRETQIGRGQVSWIPVIGFPGIVVCHLTSEIIKVKLCNAYLILTSIKSYKIENIFDLKN